MRVVFCTDKQVGAQNYTDRRSQLTIQFCRGIESHVVRKLITLEYLFLDRSGIFRTPLRVTLPHAAPMTCHFYSSSSCTQGSKSGKAAVPEFKAPASSTKDACTEVEDKSPRTT